MSATVDQLVVARITGRMNMEERRRAFGLIAKGARDVEMPASWEIRHGEAVHSDDVYPRYGTITLQARAGHVSAERIPAVNQFPWTADSRGPRRFPVSFQGSFDPATGMVRGTVTSEMKRANRRTWMCSVIAGAAVGVGVAVGEQTAWKFVYGVALCLAMLAVGWLTDRREAKRLVPDLERIAALVAGTKPVHRGFYNSPAWEEFDERRRARTSA